jgi:cellulose biosynthesis protein BcsQ
VRATSPLGQIVTFYSYKGGTGRTMALANVAYLLAQTKARKKVLMVDWDLEAPGLHRYVLDLMRESFPNDDPAKEFDAQPGLVDLFQELNGLISEDSAQAASSVLNDIPLDRFISKTDIPGLHLLKAGCFDAGYSAAVNTFQWEGLHRRAPRLFEAFGKRLAECYDYVLIDSRTGLTDSSGICTCILPDVLVIVFTPNRQSLLGGLDMARSAGDYRKDSDDLRPLRILPLASRIEAAEPSLRERWRFGDTNERIPGYQPAFENLFCSLYGLPSCDLGGYFSEVQIQHLPRFAYGEEIAARVEPADRLSLTRSFEHFLKWIVSARAPWEEGSGPEEEVVEPPVRDEAWLVNERIAGEIGLQKLGVSGYMEASFFLSPPLPGATSPRLFQAAQAAQVPGTGWPIGAVLTIATESRPQPAPDGLTAEIVDKSTKSYDHWALRADGSFYFFRNLEEDTEYLLTDDRVARITELLVYCTRLYASLGTERNAQVLVSVSFGGLAGRSLDRQTPDPPDGIERLAGVCMRDSVQSEVMTELADIMPNLDKLVEVLTTPLFANFDFYQLLPVERNRLISKNLMDWGLQSHAELAAQGADRR